jgi:hypothetical protein
MAAPPARRPTDRAMPPKPAAKPKAEPKAEPKAAPKKPEDQH